MASEQKLEPAWYPGTLGTHYAGVKLPDPVSDPDSDWLRCANIAESLAQGARLRKEVVLAVLQR